MTDTRNQQRSSANRRTVGKLSLVVIGMFGFGFLLVPIYDVFCEITGLNGKTGELSTQDAMAMGIDENRTVTVQFVAITQPDLPWEFQPQQLKMEIHPGEVGETSYFAKNLANSDVLGQAIPSVTPGRGAGFFSKTECFCFTEQVLKAGEEKDMPVRFVVDPRLPRDIETLTLSYTFFKK